MKKIILFLILLVCIPFSAQSAYRSGFTFDSPGVDYDFVDNFDGPLAAGSVHGTLSTSGHTRTVVDTYATTELVPNGGFETVTAAGPPANFGTWGETRPSGDGNIEVETTIIHGGTNSCKITTTTNQNYVSNPLPTLITGKQYSLNLYIYGDGTNYSQIGIRDEEHGTWLQAPTSSLLKDASWNLYQVTFTATTSINNGVSLRLYSPPTTGIAYFDDVSVLPTSGLLSITGGNLSFAGGKASPAWANPAYWSSASTGARLGKMLLSNYNVSTLTANGSAFGFGTDQTTLPQVSNVFVIGSGGTYAYDNATALSINPVMSVSTNYYLNTVLRGTGAMYFLKSSTDPWKLLWLSSVINATTLYPSIVNNSSAFTTSFIRVPALKWLPTPLLSHGFASVTTPSDGAGHAETTGLGSGGSGVVMTGATFSVVGGKAVNTPVVATTGGPLNDGNVVTNGNFSAWTGDNPDGWTLDFTEDAGRYVTEVSGKARFVSNAEPAVQIINSNSLTVGAWYSMASTATTVAAYMTTNNSFSPLIGFISGTNTATTRAINTPFYLRRYTTPLDTTVDSVSVLPLTLSELFLTAPLSTSHVVASAKITKSAAANGVQSGLVTNLDSASSPANFLIWYLDGIGNLKVDINVAGTYTNLISAAATYSAGTPIVAIYDAGAIRAYYNNVLIGTATLSAGQITAVGTNKLHGLFSTSALDSLDDLTIYPRGNEGEYGLLNQFIN